MNNKKVEIISTLLKRIPADALDNVYTEKKMKQLLKDVDGVYALFKEENLYYIGQGDLYQRLLAHYKKDRHKNKWNTFAFAKLLNPQLREELESLLITLTNPPGNKNTPRVNKQDKITEDTIREIINITKKYSKESKEKLFNSKNSDVTKKHISATHYKMQDFYPIILQILKLNKPLKRQEIVTKVRKQIYDRLSETDKEILKSGGQRWEETLRWAITHLAKDGVIVSKIKNQWELKG